MNKILTLVSLLYSFSTFGQSWDTVGNNSSTGNLTIGSATNNSYSKFVLRGPNFPHGVESRREIIFDFAAAGEASVRSYRGTSWDTYLQFMTSDGSNTGGVPATRLHISGNGDVGIGNTKPSSLLTIGAMTNTNVETNGITLSRNHNVIEFINSDYSLGYGAKIYGKDEGTGRTSLRIAVRCNTSNWHDAVYIGASDSNGANNGLVGIGNISPTAGLDVKQTYDLGDGTLVAARLGQAYNHWTYFGAGNSGRIRGSNEGYLWLESNPQGTGDNGLYLNTTSPGDVSIAVGGGKVGIGAVNPSARLHVIESAIRNTAKSEKTGVRFEIGRQKLTLKALRTANQTDWNSTSLKLQAMIDGTNHQSIDFVNDEAFREHVDIYTGNQVFSTRFYANGNVLIGKTSQTNTSYKLDVAGKVRANEIVVNTTGADYVFEDAYQLKTLGEVEIFIRENGHLPGIPSAEEMQTEGMVVGELNTKLLEKIEELTLYMIKLSKDNERLKDQNQHILKELESLKSKGQ